MRLMDFYFVLNVVGFLLSSSTTNAADALEYYSSRPDILEVKSQEHAGNNAWDKLKMGHLEALAQILGLYPEHEKYFLARDMELLYDLARLLSHELGDALEVKKIHLLNVSRLSKTSLHLKAYLEQEGIKESDLAQGKKILLIDTGFMGSIPKAIKEHYPEHLRKSIQTHLMCSANDEHPSSRMFLKSLNSLADNVCPSTLHGSIIAYEHRPRFSHRADRYVEVNGRWVPAAPTDGSTSDGQVSKDEALKDMEDIKAFGLVKKNQQKYLSRKKIWQQLQKHLLAEDKQSLIALFDAEPLKNHRMRSAMARDMVEVLATNLSTPSISLPIEDLGLTPIKAQAITSNKIDIMQKNPRWRPFLEDPHSGLETLLKNGDFTTLRQLVDVVHDSEFDIVLAQKLGKYASDRKMTEQFQEIAQAIIDNKDQDKRQQLIEHTFSNPNSVPLQGVLSEFINSANWEECFRLVYVFMKPHTKAWAEQLVQLLDYTAYPVNATDTNEPSRLYWRVLMDVFTCAHAQNFGRALERIIERHIRLISQIYVGSPIFPQIALINFRPHIHLLIRMGDQAVRCYVARFFKYEESIDYTDELFSLISLGDNTVRAILAENAFKPKVVNNRKGALELLIRKGDHVIHGILLSQAFSGEEACELGPLLFLLLTTAEDSVWESWIQSLENFSEDKPKPRLPPSRGRRAYRAMPYHPFKNLVTEANYIEDKAERDRFIQESLGLSGEPMQVSVWPKKGVSYSGKKYESLLKVQEKLARKWSKSPHIKPDEILVIVDNDNTLVLPRKKTSNNYEAREGALGFLEELEKAGVHIIIASAHREFTKTLAKLEAIGAAKILNIKSPDADINKEESDLVIREYCTQIETSVAVEKLQHGKVASIRRLLEDENFDRKAYVPMALSAATKHAIKQVYLVDDSETIIHKFIKDLMEFAPYHLPIFEEAHIYHLEKALGKAL